MWTEVRNALPFLSGMVNSAKRGDLVYSLHRDGRKGWVVKRFRGKTFVSQPVMFDSARNKYNILLASSE